MEPPFLTDLRRSPRVPLEVSITIEEENVTVNGTTVVVNLHGALIRSTRAFALGTELVVTAYLTSKSARARVVYLPPGNPFACGIELEIPQNIWGISLVPDDWNEERVRD